MAEGGPAASAPRRRGRRSRRAPGEHDRAAHPMIDVLLVSMPFGPLLSPSLGLSLLQPQVERHGLTCRVDYYTLPFAERIGESLYSRIITENRTMSRAFVGEWIFSHALFDWTSQDDERYLAEVLMKPPSWLGRNPTRPPAPAQVRAILRARDGPRRSSTGAPARCSRHDRRSSASPASSSSISRRWRSRNGSRCSVPTPSSCSAAPTAKRRWGSRRCGSFHSSTPSFRVKAITCSASSSCR